VAPLLEANVAVRSVRDREREQTATACAIIYFFFLYMYQLVSVAACCRAPAPLVPRHAGSCGVVDRIFLGDVTRALNIFSKSSSENEIKIHSEIENLSKKQVTINHFHYLVTYIPWIYYTMYITYMYIITLFNVCATFS
jgi:hypothetical protein